MAEVSTSEVASWSIGSLEPLPGAGDPSLAPQAPRNKEHERDSRQRCLVGSLHINAQTLTGMLCRARNLTRTTSSGPEPITCKSMP